MTAAWLWLRANRTLLNVQVGRRFLQAWIGGCRLLVMAPDWPHPARYRLVQLLWWRFG